MRKKYKLKHHLLHSRELHFKAMPEGLKDLENKVIYAPLPDYFEAIIKHEF